MKVKNNKIVEATEAELFHYYLSRGFDDVMDFNTYKRSCQNNGTNIIGKDAENEDTEEN